MHAAPTIVLCSLLAVVFGQGHDAMEHHHAAESAPPPAMEMAAMEAQPRFIPYPFFNIAAKKVDVISPFTLAAIEGGEQPGVVDARSRLIGFVGLPKSSPTQWGTAASLPPAVSTYTSTIVHTPNREKLYAYSYGLPPPIPALPALPAPSHTRNAYQFDTIMPYNTEYTDFKHQQQQPLVYSSSPITNIICYTSGTNGPTLQCP